MGGPNDRTRDLGEAALIHFGVKGMRWGVRKDRSASPARASQPMPSSRKRSIKTSGGTNIKAHPDALKLAAKKQKAKGSGIHSLSNSELKEAINRMQLEENYKRLNTQQKGAGAKFVSQLLGQQGKQQVQSVVNQQVTSRVQEQMKKATK